MKKLSVLICALFAVATVSAQRVAVLDFNAGVGVSQADVDGISAIFNTYFSPRGYTLVERTQIDRVIDEQNFQRGKLTQTQMVRIGEILNVSKVVIGDVNIVMNQYNVDVRVVNVESGTISAKDGATWSPGSSYRTMMSQLASRLAGKIAITPTAPVTSSATTPASPSVRKRTTVEVVMGYLKVFPTELGVFPSEPTSVIAQINNQHMHDYDTWRIPTAEELALLRANGYLADVAYMSKSTNSSSGVVLLVTDDNETYSQKENRRKEEARLKQQIAEGKGANGVYEVGFYYDVDGKQGVVFEVTTDGKHGKIVSLTQTITTWENAKTWCSELGRGWRSPTVKELQKIYKKKDAVNAVLAMVGKEIVYPGVHWSNEEFDSDKGWYVNMSDGYTSVSRKFYKYYVRAVSAF